MEMHYLGIDPGKQGGIAVIGNGAPVLLKLQTATEMDILRFLDNIPSDSFAALERPAGAPTGKMSVISQQKLHDSVGFLRGMLVACGFPFEFVLPRKWQRDFGLLRKDKNETQTAKKNRHKQAAERLFPKVKVTHAVSDALLLAEWARRQNAALQIMPED